MNPETLPIVAKALNTAMVLLLAYGLTQRRRPKVHMPVMLTAFAVDVLNVLLVEIAARGGKGTSAVVEGISAFTGEGTLLQRFHVIASLLFIAGYVVAAVTGTRLHRRGSGRTVHKVNAAIFIATRLASYVTSFWM